MVQYIGHKHILWEFIFQVMAKNVVHNARFALTFFYSVNLLRQAYYELWGCYVTGQCYQNTKKRINFQIQSELH